VQRQLWKLRSRRGVTAVCTLLDDDDRTFPPKWTVVVTWNTKPVSRLMFRRMIDAVASANQTRDRLRLRDWTTVEES
jgi:hypothetical protein